MFGETLGKIDKIFVPMLLFELSTSANIEVLLVKLKVHKIEMFATHDELKYKESENHNKNIQIIILDVILNHEETFFCYLNQYFNNLINFVIGLH